MNESQWREFLQRQSREVLADATTLEFIPPEMIASSWLGYPPASEAELQQLEARLNVTLPPSYRSFLKVSNGCKYPSAFVYDLLPASKVGWFRDLHADWIEAWLAGEREAGGPTIVSREEHMIYGPKQNSCAFSRDYWMATLTISENGDDAILLLNPEVVDANGEWEAWFFANWAPGATRYRSFSELMENELEQFIRLREG